jgi:CRISPR/Cas system-associated protein Cas5 (RAMP superfamily)
MEINGIVMLSKTIRTTDDLTNEFKELFNSPEAKEGKSIVYFFMSEKPISRVCGQSNILYIGKTKNTIRTRYFQHSENLASKKNGTFYKHIIENYGGLKMGYVLTETPRETENKFFNEYYKTHLEYPPKSKVG